MLPVEVVKIPLLAGRFHAVNGDATAMAAGLPTIRTEAINEPRGVATPQPAKALK